MAVRVGASAVTAVVAMGVGVAFGVGVGVPVAVGVGISVTVGTAWGAAQADRTNNMATPPAKNSIPSLSCVFYNDDNINSLCGQGSCARCPGHTEQGVGHGFLTCALPIATTLTR